MLQKNSKNVKFDVLAIFCVIVRYLYIDKKFECNKEEKIEKIC